MATTIKIKGRRYEFKLPVAALRLNEDIQALKRIIRELDSLEPSNVSGRTEGVSVLLMMQRMAWLCKAYAERKLRHEYLKRM